MAGALIRKGDLDTGDTRDGHPGERPCEDMGRRCRLHPRREASGETNLADATTAHPASRTEAINPVV